MCPKHNFQYGRRNTISFVFVGMGVRLLRYMCKRLTNPSVESKRKQLGFFVTLMWNKYYFARIYFLFFVPIKRQRLEIVSRELPASKSPFRCYKIFNNVDFIIIYRSERNLVFGCIIIRRWFPRECIMSHVLMSINMFHVSKRMTVDKLWMQNKYTYK